MAESPLPRGTQSLGLQEIFCRRSHGNDRFRWSQRRSRYPRRVPHEEGPRGLEERDRRRDRLRRAGARPVTQYARQRRQRHHRPGVGVQARLGSRGQRRLGAGQDAVRDRGSRGARQHHPDVGFGRRAEGDLARPQEAPQEGRCGLLLTWFLDRLQGPDRRHPAQGRGRDHGRAQGLGPKRAAQLPLGCGYQFELCGRAGRHGPGA